MEYPAGMKNRLKRAVGQLNGVINMMEENKDCREVITQLSASRSAIDRAIGLVVSSNLIECAKNSIDKDGRNPEEVLAEAVELLVKSR
ncbi:metal-sensitive transcriptional regulator [Metabacillus sp. GX 13764]|uniref:metal-sensitive transcriptional regulator n=1 Tax=Metabacillus kandeliae TaxID=2900151 RepID=UPI001E3F6648|nr:metal-sensitive transcriptional regulator [Metabacillus kandeliae]MCD7035945.1 metal-sensitive transcriptional regulator [Metabacillus kandeliae]